jgi:(5-formylfuran-3-yl)methyl phosphate synthase
MIAGEIRAPVSRPLLLVSVRNARESADALAGGADIIDVKEPTRGPLGPADRDHVEEVLSCVGGQRPVSVAAGELLDANDAVVELPTGTKFVKFGLSRCARNDGWYLRLAQINRQLLSVAQIVPVAYADWQEAEAPPPEEVLRFATEFACPIVLVDTFDKRRGGLFEFWSFSSAKDFVGAAHAVGTAVALAGRLRDESILWAVEAGADIVGVRSAVCAVERTGELEQARVERLRQTLIDGVLTPSETRPVRSAT